MFKKLLMIIALPTLSGMSGCATRTIASPFCPQEAPETASLRVPGPDPLLFEKCKTELLDQTSDQGLTPSCKQLDEWRLSTLTNSSDNGGQEAAKR